MSENNKNIVQPEEFNVKKVFQDVEYVVPIYQRNYAWTKTEIEQLLNDIRVVSKDFPGRYYLGTLIVNKLGSNVFEVIDGQQRLTTLYLLLAYLNDESITGHSLSFEAREKSNKTLQDIFAIKGKEELKKDTGYSDEIVNGYADIVNYFKEEDKKDKQFIEEFKNKLDKIIIVRVQVPQNIDLNHYFEIMNTRGEQLELHEIVKAKIISAIADSDTNIKNKYQKVAATIWDACAQMDKYVQMCFQGDTRKSIFGDIWDVFQPNDFDALCNCFNEATESNIEKFVLKDKLANPPNPPEAAKNATGKGSDDEDIRFESIISFPNFILQVNKAMSEVAKDVNESNEKDDENSLDDNRFIDTMKKRYDNSDNAKDFIYNLLKYRYLFDRYIIKREYVGQYKVDGKWSLKKLVATKDTKPLYKATYSMEKGNDDEEDASNKKLCLLESCLRITYTSPKTMHWVAKVIKAADKQVDKPEDKPKDKDGVITKSIIDLLEKYCCEKMGEAAYWEHTGFEIERIVFSYLDYLLWRENAVEFNTFQFQFRNSIEHFFPQNPSDDNHSEVKEVNNFGNLALITVSANSKFSNYPPIVKGEHEDIIKQSPKLMRMAKLLETKKKWEDDEIREHYKEMLTILYEEMVDKLKDEQDKYPYLEKLRQKYDTVKGNVTEC